ncbi:hypothetical protein SO802_003165 [Lithocarpus litseifolius]|uniref:Uncharacterized protein n=1 Tax=Lithocarpus litseifolius TaxID=425828 RepID=A0AAW2E4P5_9ROSI
MCRSSDYYHGYQSNGRDRLRIRGFFVRFSGLDTRKPIPKSLTLLYLPRINDNVLEVDGSKIRPDSPAFVTLHRVVNAKTRSENEVIFGSRERVRANEAVRFEVFLRDEKVLKGIFRKGEGSEWKLECKCAIESEVRVTEAEVHVAVEGHVAMNEKVEMVVKNSYTRTKKCARLEEIPEEREEQEEESESDGCCRCCGEEESGSDGGDLKEDCTVEMDVEGVKWAVDMGIWVMCFGLGFLVSKASVKSLRRRKMF